MGWARCRKPARRLPLAYSAKISVRATVFGGRGTGIRQEDASILPNQFAALRTPPGAWAKDRALRLRDRHLRAWACPCPSPSAQSWHLSRRRGLLAPLANVCAGRATALPLRAEASSEEAHRNLLSVTRSRRPAIPDSHSCRYSGNGRETATLRSLCRLRRTCKSSVRPDRSRLTVGHRWSAYQTATSRPSQCRISNHVGGNCADRYLR